MKNSLNRRGPNVKKQLIAVLVKEPDGAWNKSFEIQVQSTAKFWVWFRQEIPAIKCPFLCLFWTSKKDKNQINLYMFLWLDLLHNKSWKLILIYSFLLLAQKKRIKENGIIPEAFHLRWTTRKTSRHAMAYLNLEAFSSLCLGISLYFASFQILCQLPVLPR